MELTAEQINELKNLGLITSTLPAATILELAETVDLAKVYRYIGVTIPSEDIEKALEPPVPPVPPGPEDEYFTIEILEDGVFKFSNYYDHDIKYSTDKSTWADLGASTDVHTGDKLYIKGTNTTLASMQGSDIEGTYFGLEGGSAKFNVSGNIMSLLYGDDFKDKVAFPEGSTYSFAGMLSNSNVVSAEDLILPATTVVGCYFKMFEGSDLLTTAPVLPADTLTENCYTGMFKDCSLLTYVKALAIHKPYIDPTVDDWLLGVAANGTFVKDASVTAGEDSSDFWYINDSGNIPTSWTIQDAE